MIPSLRYADADLEAMLVDGESDLVERKESWKGDAPDSSRQAVCAFANDMPGHQKPGVLFVGARGDGTPSGLSITDELLCTLADIKTDGQTLPPPAIVVEKRLLHGAEIAVVTVQPADAPPVRYRGRIWIRVGPRRSIATAQEERMLNERRRYRDLPYDLHPVSSCSLSELSRALFEEDYLPAVFAPDVLAANDRTYEQRLAVCRMIGSVDDPVPTVAGVLALARNPRERLPGAYIQFLRVAGTAWSDPVADEALCDGPLPYLMRRLDEKLDAHNRTAVDIVSAACEIRRSLYPRVALQQLIRNAVMHRSYEATHAPVRVYWFDDRIEISSPGGPFGSVNEKNFGQPGVCDYRNPHVAEVMRMFGLVQRFGIGIQTAQAELKKNGNPPAEFIVTSERIVATMRTRGAGASSII